MTAIATTLLTLTLAVGPLSDKEQTQVDTARDGEVFDDSALYPLLSDALTWKVGDEAGATIPDYEAILKSPEKYRGQLFLIEGDFVGVPYSRQKQGLIVGKLNRPGPWDGKLEQWGVVVTRADGSHDSVLVYLTDPPQGARAGQKLRLVARFYKVWQTKRILMPEEELKGGTKADAPVEQFLTFVGHSATVQAGSGVSLPSLGASKLPWVVAVLVIVMLFGWWRLRRTLKPRLTPAQERRRRRAEEREAGEAAQDVEGVTDEPLPEDPIEALEEMERRRAIAAAREAEEETTPELEALKAVAKERKAAQSAE